jgi:colanic acid biosynthesis glycosyl transferase WcaI
MNLNVLIVTHNFIPDFDGAATMQFELAQHLAGAGHNVTVVASAPYRHPGIIEQNKLSVDEYIEGIHVIRPKPPRLNGSYLVIRQINSELANLACIMRGMQVKPVDIIFLLTPPITFPLWAAVIKWIRKSILMMYLQDIFPEDLVSMNLMSRSNVIFRILKVIERISYKSVDYIGVHSPKNRKYVISCGVDEKKVHVVPLWVDTAYIKKRPEISNFSKINHLENKFVVMYAGNIGMAMGAKTIPQAAKLLENEKDVQFVVVGEGSRLQEMRDEIQRLGVKNLLLLPPQPREELPEVLASSDVLLVMLKKEASDNPNGYFQAVIPHKLLSNMASGKPILLAAESDSDAANLVRISKCGFVVPPEDPEAFANEILHMKQNKNELSTWGKNGHDYAKKHFDSQRQVMRMEKLFESLLLKNQFEFNDPWNTEYEE